MRLALFVAGVASAAVLSVVGGPSAHAQTTSNQNNNQPAKVNVTVNEGDTLSSIADAHQTTYVRIFDANTNIADPDIIYTGDSLRVPSADEQLADREIPADYVAANPIQAHQAPAAANQTAASQPLAVPAQAATSGCGDNSYANFIYTHESGCRTTAMSPNGCYGIGQACPASKIAYCGADYACQNEFFTAYAGKYGGWAGAYSFWVSHGWW